MQQATQEALEWLDDQVRAEHEIEAKRYDLQSVVWPIILLNLQRESNFDTAEAVAKGSNSERGMQDARNAGPKQTWADMYLSLIHISEPTRLALI
eukprot:1007962-Alexandrium_andersonii.AAC.1